MASVSSSNTTLLPPWHSESNNTSFRDVSFSSYLDSSEESYIHSLVESFQFRKNKAEEGEIDVFSADKYFNGENEVTTTTTTRSGGRKHHKQYDKDGIEEVVIVNQPRTPSIHSESSSWNSQSALLKRGQTILLPPRGSISSRKVQGKKLFSCCSCYDKNSVEGEPVMNPSIKTKVERKTIDDHDPFLFTPLSEIPKKVERMLSWDTESDASSDLFEIEVGAGGPTQHCTSDMGPATLTTTCYAPSEASIEWSVVTASAADFSTVSDAEDRRSVSRSKNMAPKKMNNSKMSGILLGCKSQKAVRVAGELVYRTMSGREKLERERRERYSDSFSAMTRFQAEAKVAGFGPKQKKQVACSH